MASSIDVRALNTQSSNMQPISTTEFDSNNSIGIFTKIADVIQRYLDRCKEWYLCQQNMINQGFWYKLKQVSLYVGTIILPLSGLFYLLGVIVPPSIVVSMPIGCGFLGISLFCYSVAGVSSAILNKHKEWFFDRINQMSENGPLEPQILERLTEELNRRLNLQAEEIQRNLQNIISSFRYNFLNSGRHS